MGKVDGFLLYQRAEAAWKDPLERIGNFNEFKPGLPEKQRRETGSERARQLLADFDHALSKFKKIIPRDYRRMLREIARCEAQGMTRDEAEMEAFRETTKGR